MPAPYTLPANGFMFQDGFDLVCGCGSQHFDLTTAVDDTDSVYRVELRCQKCSVIVYANTI